jgi:hypothetical protein
MLQMILTSSRPPDSGARAEMYAGLQRQGPALRRLVTVPLGDGLWASLVRTIMRGFVIVAKQNFEHVIASSERHGIDLILAAASQHSPDRAQLTEVVGSVFSALEMPRPARKDPGVAPQV